MFKKIKRYLHSPYYEIGQNIINRWPRIMSDKWYIKTQWLRECGYRLDLENPRTFNEKIQWLKLFDRNPLYTLLVDKYRVKEWVAQKIGSQYVVPTLATYKSVQEITPESLPLQFVLKCNHDSGGVIVCRDKASFDFKKAMAILDSHLKNNHYYYAREWAYKHVKPMLFAEQYLEDSVSEDALVDYKWFCFNGEPKIMYLCRERGSHPVTAFFDMEYRHLPFTMANPIATTLPEKPAQFEKMKQLAATLSQGIPHVRVDFYLAQNQIYFGEMTFYDSAGYGPFNPPVWNYTLGEMLILPSRHKM